MKCLSRIRVRIRKSARLALWLSLCTAAGFGSACLAGESNISVNYSGSGYDTNVDNLYDGFPVSLSILYGEVYEWKGTFGKGHLRKDVIGDAKITVTTEFIYSDSIVCDAGYDVPQTLVSSASVLNLPDESQLHGFSDSGWMCFNSASGHFYGYMQGAFRRGTGPFSYAAGEWATDFDGFMLWPDLGNAGFRAIKGVVSGTVRDEEP